MVEALTQMSYKYKSRIFLRWTSSISTLQATTTEVAVACLSLELLHNQAGWQRFSMLDCLKLLGRRQITIKSGKSYFPSCCFTQLWKGWFSPHVAYEGSSSLNLFPITTLDTPISLCLVLLFPNPVHSQLAVCV